MSELITDRQLDYILTLMARLNRHSVTAVLEEMGYNGVRLDELPKHDASAVIADLKARVKATPPRLRGGRGR